MESGSLINEEQYLREISRQQRINAHLLERLKDRGAEFRCNWCSNVSPSKRMTIHWNERTGEILFLCFRACQHFPEPFRDTEAGAGGWHRIDPWQDYKRPQPKLRKGAKHKNYRVVDAPSRQTRLGESDG